MADPDKRISLLVKVAWACAALVLAITTLSAFIRLSQAAVGCEPWPQCHTQASPHAAQDAPMSRDGAVAAARIAHRVTAVAALLLVIALVMTTLSRAPVLRREGRIALALLALALFLAILGRWSTGARVPAVMLGNLLAGFAMFAVSCRLARTAGRQTVAPMRQDRLVPWARLGLALLLTQIILGGLVSAGRAGPSCPQLLACDMAAGSWQFLNPWHETALVAADPANAAGALIHGLHRLGALGSAAVLLPLGVAAWRAGRREGAAVIVLLVLQGALGALLVAQNLPLALALAHNVGAALLLAAVLGLSGSERPAHS
ncbi:MAG: COX15/CtaA family protein [Ramlibacter sp.]|nr:COX15/CtaA family protein [Ramlibacter sp.]